MILVVGVGRSGTTATARVLQTRLGVAMGGPGRKHPSNPNGDYENKEFRRLGRWRWKEKMSVPQWTEEFSALVAAQDEPWGFKDPVSCFFLEDMLALLPNAHVVWAQRDREAVLESWCRNYGKQGRDVHAKRIADRLKVIERVMATVPHLPVDFTEQVDEDDLALLFYSWLRIQGQTGLFQP